MKTILHYGFDPNVKKEDRKLNATIIRDRRELDEQLQSPIFGESEDQVI